MKLNTALYLEKAAWLHFPPSTARQPLHLADEEMAGLDTSFHAPKVYQPPVVSAVGTIRRGLSITLHCLQGEYSCPLHNPDNPEHSPVLLEIHGLRQESGFATELLSVGDKDTI